MAIVPNRDRTPKPAPIQLPLKGMAIDPDDSGQYALICQNLETKSDKFMRTRKGIMGPFNFNTGSGPQVVGLGYGFINGGDQLIAVKDSGQLQYTGIDGSVSAASPTLNFSAIALPWTTSPLQLAVNMDSVPAGPNGSPAAAVALVARNASGVAMWDGSTCTNATGSPASGMYVCWVPPHLYVSKGDSVLYFSDTANAFNWPSTNTLSLDLKWGPITGLARLDDKLLIFTQRAILYLSGDPAQANQFYIGVLQPDIGCTYPQSISVWGSAVAFMFNADAYIFSGSVSLISEPIAGVFGTPLAPVGGGPGRWWGALGPRHYVVRPSYASNNGPSTGPDTSYWYERVKVGSWMTYNYDVATSFGFQTPAQACVKYFGFSLNGYVMSGGDGSLYLQRDLEYQDLYNNESSNTQSDSQLGCGPSLPVVSWFKTRRLSMGSSYLAKQPRVLTIMGSGTLTVLNLYMIQASGVITEYQLLSGGSVSLPYEDHLADSIFAGGIKTAVEFQLELKGTNLILEEINMVMRGIRYSLVGP